MLNKWKEKREAKKKEKADKWKKPTLNEKLEELAKIHGKQTGTKHINGKMHYFFEDGSEIYFSKQLSGVQTVYVEKGWNYELYYYH